MSVKVAINGFGRIGRLAFRQMFGAEGYEVLAFKAQLLLGDATDPQTRSEAIRDMVHSIALIPDTIKRKEYVKYCAGVMDIDAETLGVEVARNRDGVKGNREAQDFLRRQQQREYDSTKPSALYVEKQPSGEAMQPITGGSTIETLERELTKYLIKSGHRTLVVEEDKKYQDVNVAEYIFSDLDFDGIEFRPGVYRTIVELYRALENQVLLAHNFDRQHHLYKYLLRW